MADSSEAMRRNVRLYPWYAALFNAFFWMPVFFLYFGAHLPLAQVLQLEGIYYAAVVVLEIPSGYFSDRIGRRTTLLVSAVLLFAAYATFFFGSSFAVFALAQVLLAAGIAANSGTDTSFHYDSLASTGDESEYEDREAIVARNALFATGLAALIGGFAASVDLRNAYALSMVVALGSVLLVLQFREPDEASTEVAAPFLAQLRNCLAHLREPALLWLFGFALLSVVVNHVPYEFYQPYLGVLGAELEFSEHTAAATGIHAAIATFIAAWFAARSARIDGWLGTGPTLLLASAVQIAIIVAMASVLHAVVVLLILLRGIPGALAHAPLHAAVTPKIPRRERATYLSIQSLAGRLAFSVLLAALALVAGDAGVDHWPVLSELLMISAVVGGVGWLVLAVSVVGVKLR